MGGAGVGVGACGRNPRLPQPHLGHRSLAVSSATGHGCRIYKAWPQHSLSSEAHGRAPDPARSPRRERCRGSGASEQVSDKTAILPAGPPGTCLSGCQIT